MKSMFRSLSMTLALSMLSGTASANEPAETRKVDLMLKGTPERLQSGAHGKVVLVGDLDASGVMSHLSVASSSGSEELDASFLAQLEGSRVKTTGEPQQATRIELTLTTENFDIKDGNKIRLSLRPIGEGYRMVTIQSGGLGYRTGISVRFNQGVGFNRQSTPLTVHDESRGVSSSVADSDRPLPQ